MNSTDKKATQFASSSCSRTHCVGLTHAGEVFSWAVHPWGNRFGQLCQGGSQRSVDPGLGPARVDTGALQSAPVVAAVTGGDKDSGHTVLVTADGGVWACGCDRWQQLGLSGGGAHGQGDAAGYTWAGGRIWQHTLHEVTTLRDWGVQATEAALGADHTVVLAANRRDVYTWGRGEHGQLGTQGKAFLATPGRSCKLSAPEGRLVVGLFAKDNCSAAVHRRVGDTGHADRDEIVTAGRCSSLTREMAAALGGRVSASPSTSSM